MSFDNALRAVVADKLGVHPSALKSVRVVWDDGDRYDPTYGDSPNSPPTFEIEVILVNGGYSKLDTAWTFGALLAAVLGVENAT